MVGKAQAVDTPTEEVMVKDWISTKDRLPEFDTQVLVAFRTVCNELQYTTANYVNQSVCIHNDRRVPTWWVAVSRGHELNSTTVEYWQPIERIE